MLILTTGLVALPGAPIGSGLLVAGAGGETVQRGGLQVSFGGSVAPQVLPRTGTTPVSVAIRGGVRALAGSPAISFVFASGSNVGTGPSAPGWSQPCRAGCPAPACFTSAFVRTCRTGG